MIEAFKELNPVVQALLAGLFTWGLTSLGAGTVFFMRTINRSVLNYLLGFAAGVMIAASYWSLLAPAIEMSEELSVPPYLPAMVGFALGGAFLLAIDHILPHLHPGRPRSQAEGLRTTWERTVLLVLAITLHNIPEGLAVGVAFGAVAYDLPGAGLAGAAALAMGIGLQNFPEGIAVSMPLRREGFSRLRSFWYGQLSALVEPVAAVIGATAVLLARPALPYALAFAAGAMIFVVVEELIPESHREGGTDIPTVGLLTGFLVMMFLDVSLG